MSVSDLYSCINDLVEVMAKCNGRNCSRCSTISGAGAAIRHRCTQLHALKHLPGIDSDIAKCCAYASELVRMCQQLHGLNRRADSPMDNLMCGTIKDLVQLIAPASAPASTPDK